MTTAPQPAIVSWFWAARPFSLSASVAPVLVGTALATSAGGIDWLLFALVLTASVAVQIGTNLTDEYSDHRRYAGEGKYLAPHKVIQRGLLSERAVLAGMVVVFGYAVAAGLVIVSQTGWPILAIAVASLAVAYGYSGGPFPMGNLGLGEPLVFLFMGPVMVMGSYYVQTETVTLASFLASLPVACIVTAILHCNNLRDISEDQAVGETEHRRRARGHAEPLALRRPARRGLRVHRAHGGRDDDHTLGDAGASPAAVGRRRRAQAVPGR